MPFEPKDWSAIVVGAWNPAILSPDGIRRRLFKLPDGSPVELEVRMDQPGGFRVGYGGIRVAPSLERLAVEPVVSDEKSLIEACDLCRQALSQLPETPIRAAGVNVRYFIASATDRMIDLTACSLDAELTAAMQDTIEVSHQVKIALNPGVVNLRMNHSKGANGLVNFNFHLDSTKSAELGEWLGRGKEFVAFAEKMLATFK